MIDAIYKSISTLQAVRKQVALRKTLAEEADDAAVSEAAKALLESLDAWQESVSTPQWQTFQDVINFEPQLDTFLMNVYQQADAAVLGLTRGQRDRLDDLRPAWKEALDQWNALVSEDIPAFNEVAGQIIWMQAFSMPKAAQAS